MDEGVIGTVQDEPLTGQPIKYDEKVKADKKLSKHYVSFLYCHYTSAVKA